MRSTHNMCLPCFLSLWISRSIPFLVINAMDLKTWCPIWFSSSRLLLQAALALSFCTEWGACLLGGGLTPLSSNSAGAGPHLPSPGFFLGSQDSESHWVLQFLSWPSSEFLESLGAPETRREFRPGAGAPSEAADQGLTSWAGLCRSWGARRWWL